jgi:hypothetical protein
MTTTNANPFISTRELWGKQEPFTDAAKVAAALAEAWEGATLGECEGGPYGIGRVMLGDLAVTIRADSRSLGRIEAIAGAPALTRQTGTLYGDQYDFPKASADTAKGAAKLAADLKRRVVDPAAEPLKAVQAKVQDYRDNRAGLERTVEAFRASFPTAEISGGQTIADWEADFRIPHGTSWITGRLNARGSITLNRVPSIAIDKAAAVFGLLYGEA